MAPERPPSGPAIFRWELPCSLTCPVAARLTPIGIEWTKQFGDISIESINQFHINLESFTRVCRCVNQRILNAVSIRIIVGGGDFTVRIVGDHGVRTATRPTAALHSSKCAAWVIPCYHNFSEEHAQLLVTIAFNVL